MLLVDVLQGFWRESEVCDHLFNFHGIQQEVNPSSARSLPVAIIGCTVLGAAVGTFDYGGKNIAGGGSLSQEEKRNNFFKPTSLRPDFVPRHGEGP